MVSNRLAQHEIFTEMDSRSASMHDSASLLCDFGDPNGSASIESGEARALSGWRIKRFESSVSDC